MTIKKSAADEILENMVGGLEKFAAMSYGAFKKEVDAARTSGDCKKLSQLQSKSGNVRHWDPLAVERYVMDARRAAKCADDGQSADDKEANDNAELDQAAVDQAIDNLISAADLLDASGFEKHAEFVDRLLKTFAKKKSI